MTVVEEQSAKIRKKLYAQISATITFIGKNRDDVERLTSNFLQRRGISIVGTPSFYSAEHRRGKMVVTFTVTYRVHGGWRSDFIRKIEQDALDLGIEITDLDVTVRRQEIPEACPRKDCGPCEFATGKRDSPIEFVPLPSTNKTWSEGTRDPRQLSLWGKLKRRK